MVNALARSYSDWKGDTGPGAQLKEMIRQDREKEMATATQADIGRKQIDEDVLQVIRDGSWVEDGLGFVMPQVDRKLYQKCAKVLEACGGKWNRKAKATLFDDMDDVQSLMEAAETGTYVDLKKAFQQFDTPDEVSDLMMAEMDLRGQAMLTFLEPSAGTGNLIRAVVRRVMGDDSTPGTIGDLEAAEITAVEMDPARVERLNGMTGSPSQPLKKVVAGDFLQQTPEELGTFDRIIMNPPFTRFQDVDHVRHAFKFLAPGGTLVSIMSPGFTFRQDNKAKLFRDWIEIYPGWSHVPLPAGAFKASGTEIRTIMLTLKRPK